jgi:hypothetical protein
MAIAGIVLLAIGSVGVCSAVILEVKYHEPLYKVMMKIFPWIFGVGGVLLGIALRGG